MCDNLTFKLCTCQAKLEPNTSFWTLKRFLGCDWQELEMGRCFYPNYSDDDKKFIKQINVCLNTNNCFDKDYTPHNNDVLNLTFYQQDTALKLEFYFDNNQWQHSVSISEYLDQKRIVFRGVIL